MKPAIMRDPRDLDPFEAHQIDLTREIDRMPSGGVNFVNMMFAKLSRIMLAVRLASGLHGWQRAAYEARSLADRNPEDKSLELLATILWAFVQFQQDSHLASEQAIQDPEVKEKARERMGSLGMDLDSILREIEEE